MVEFGSPAELNSHLRDILLIGHVGALRFPVALALSPFDQVHGEAFNVATKKLELDAPPTTSCKDNRGTRTPIEIATLANVSEVASWRAGGTVSSQQRARRARTALSRVPSPLFGLKRIETAPASVRTYEAASSNELSASLMKSYDSNVFGGDHLLDPGHCSAAAARSLSVPPFIEAIARSKFSITLHLCFHQRFSSERPQKLNLSSKFTSTASMFKHVADASSAMDSAAAWVLKFQPNRRVSIFYCPSRPTSAIAIRTLAATLVYTFAKSPH